MVKFRSKLLVFRSKVSLSVITRSLEAIILIKYQWLKIYIVEAGQR